jgi:PAS domain S-box-containing protein
MTSMRKWHKPSLRDASFRRQLAVLFVFGIFCLSLLSSLTISALAHRIVRGRWVAQGLQATGTFAEHSTLALLYFSQENAEEPVRSALALPDVRGVAIYGADHAPLLSKGEPGPDILNWPEKLELERETDRAWYFVAPVYSRRKVWEDASPFAVEPKSPELVGFVRLVMSKDTLVAIDRGIFQIIIAVSGGFGLVFLLVLLAMARRLTTPLYRLAAIMGRATEGEKQLRAEIGGPKDIVDMEMAFNSMMGVLEDREQERLANLHFFESMDRVNLTIQGASDLEQMMGDVLDVVLATFDCDRAFLMHPCDPEAASWRVPVERTKPGYPGAHALRLETAMDADLARILRELLDSDRPLQFGPGMEHPLPEDAARRFGFRSCMAMAIHPKNGKPWQFGIHQCSFPRIWTPEEELLFQEIGRRLADAAGSMMAHQALQDSEARYRRITEGLTDYQYTVHLVDGHPVRTTQSPACAVVTGYAPEEFEADPGLWIRMVAPEDREWVRDRVRLVLEGKQVEPIEHRIQRKDGALRWIRHTIILLKDASGNLVAYDGVIKDITDRKQAAESIQEREQELSTIFENAPFILVLLDGEGYIRRANALACQFAQLPKNEILGRTYGPIFHCVDALDVPEGCGYGPHCLDCGLKKAIIDTIRNGVSHHQKEITLSTSNNGKVKLHAFLLSTTNVVVSKQNMVLLSLEDITEHKALEATLIQAQKMEAVGHLAGGVAHDFNNILTAIIGFSTLAKTKSRPDDPQRPLIDQVLVCADRAAHLTQGLLAFSRKQVIIPKPVDLNAIVRSVEKLLRRLIGEDIDFTARLAGQDLILMADAGQIEQVLMNLATNARDAMPDGGSLSITTEAVLLGEDFTATHGLGRPGRHALTTVSDSGIGMDEATQKKIFDPFFTTKETGKGTGLGMSIVYGIIKQHDGVINVYSEPGKGTTFRIYLPLIPTAIEESSSVEEPLPPAGGSETILLAEDNLEVRTITSTILRESGYRVIEATDGVDATEKFSAHSKDIDLLVMDVIMPRMGGKEVHDAVKAAKPTQKILFISGYTADSIQKKGIFGEGVQFLPKPMSPFELLRKVREILDGK